MSGKAEVSLCIPVWGSRHVVAWLDAVLPSWFASGNLPALAAVCDLRIVLLSRERDCTVIAAHPAGASLLAQYEAEFCPIDDLVTGEMSAVTLTLAFVRGARRTQARSATAVAVFLNADFVLADGSLAALADVLPDSDIVLAPSLRADASAAQPLLLQAITGGKARLRSARLAEIALDHLHPTAAACFIDQKRLTSDGIYEVYRRAGPDLVISRSMQLFPLAVRPGSGKLVAEAFCDYGLFDLWAPQGRVAVLADSAAWFALELGEVDQQAGFIRPGPHDRSAIVAGIGLWSTAPQRAQAATLLVIRRGDGGSLPEAEALADLDDFIVALEVGLPPPLPVRQHPYWRTGVRRWRETAKAVGLPTPPELADWHSAPPGPSERLREGVRRLLYGRAGTRLPWQIDARLERDLSDPHHESVRPAAWGIADDRFWLARRAGFRGPEAGPATEHLVLCQDRLDVPALPAAVRSFELILTNPSHAGANRAAFMTRLATLWPDWLIDDVRVLGWAGDETRRVHLERLGRLVWSARWSELARLAPFIGRDAVLAGLSTWSRRPVAWGEGQAIRIAASRRT